MEVKTIKSFTELNAWKEGHKLVLLIYKETENFPGKEVFGLISQMRRCAVSITSNIAEGFSRITLKDKNNFFSMALGSLTELQNQLLIAKDINYLKKDIFSLVADQTIVVSKLINGLKKFNFKKGSGIDT